MKTDQKLNMTMLCDFYELTMGNGYLKAGFQDRITYFDVYFRSVPDGGGLDGVHHHRFELARRVPHSGPLDAGCEDRRLRRR